MKRIAPQTLAFVVSLGFAATSGAAITSVVETGGDNDGDTVPAKYTGQTWTITTANRPFNGAVVGNPYTVPAFGSTAPAFVDRVHRYYNDTSAPGIHPIPAYLVGMEYIMSGNDNRDNAAYQLQVTLSSASRVYMLIDNRMSTDTSASDPNVDPPTFDASHMQWIVTGGWLATTNGLNRTANIAVPDEVPLDENADNSIQNWFSVYYKDFPAGTVQLFQADNAGQNMYGVIVGPIPEPATVTLSGLILAGMLLRLWRA